MPQNLRTVVRRYCIEVRSYTDRRRGRTCRFLLPIVSKGSWRDFRQDILEWSGFIRSAQLLSGYGCKDATAGAPRCTYSTSSVTAVAPTRKGITDAALRSGTPSP